MNPISAQPSEEMSRAEAPSRERRSEISVWAEMLARVGEKNSRLFDVVMRGAPGAGASHPGATVSVVEELDRERSRIARELHAGAGQPLAGIKLNLEMLDECAAFLPQAGREALARLQTLAEQALEQVRVVSHSLHSPDWQGLAMGDALRYLVQSSGLMDRLEVEIDIQPLSAEPSHTVKIALYRC